MNPDRLKASYAQNSTVRLICDHMSARERNQTETKTERLSRVLAAEGVDLKRSDLIAAFRALEEADCGQYVEGRHGWPSRFVWGVKSLLVAGAAKGEAALIQEVAVQPSAIAESDVELIEHSFVLRPDLSVSFDLPENLSKSEAQRLCMFISALPFDVDA